jgi:aminopeptidase YwaD
MRVLEHLSKTIGSRVAGSQSENTAAEFIAEQFQALGLETTIQDFWFINWCLKERPRLEVLEPDKLDFEVAPMTYTLATPVKGIEGRVNRIGQMYIVPGYIEWPKYTIEDSKGKELGFFIANPNGKAVPLPNSKCMLPGAGVIIGKADSEKVSSWLEEGTHVRARLFNTGKFEPARSQNVIGMLGEGVAQIVVCAHYDSVFYSSGAVDNASGVQVIYDIALRLLQIRELAGKTIAFVAMGCEEPGFWGSRHFVKWLKERGMLERVEFCLNFDMVGKGDTFVLRGEEEIAAKLMHVLRNAGIKNKFTIKQDNIKASSDNWAFQEEKVPNAQVLALPFPLYHSQDDVLGAVDLGIIEGAVEIGFHLVCSLVR